MPTMANLVVKKADETTNITYDALAGSGGDGSPAVWRQDTGAAAGFPNGLRALLKMWSAWNGPKTARRITFNYVRPYATQDSTTTLYSSKDRVAVEITVVVPQAIPQTEINEGVYQAMNLAAAALTKQAMSAGYSPT